MKAAEGGGSGRAVGGWALSGQAVGGVREQGVGAARKAHEARAEHGWEAAQAARVRMILAL